MRVGLPISLFLLFAAAPCFAAKVDFTRSVRPLLEKYCYDCHGPSKQKNGLRLDRRAVAFKGGDDQGPPITPGHGADSVLVRFISGEDKDHLMPPKGKRLTGDEVALIRQWIDEGAAWPEDTANTVDPRRSHWAFLPLRRPPVPSSSNPAFRKENPIDDFIQAKLGAAGLAPLPPADRRTLIRRVYFDAIGLPPSPEEVEAFVRDPNPRAYELLVDRLLRSPRFGERWARHWLDVVRFAESAGFETNLARPNAWPYRDYVIRAFNEDKPYDQFVHEQLAGDALGQDAATGLLVGGPNDAVKSPDPVLTAQQRADELHDMVSTTGATFLGVTLGCARCHNHKFDPITQADYYSITAVLSGVQHGERPLRGPSDAEHLAQAERLRNTLAPLEAELARYQPLARLGRRLLLDDSTPIATAPGMPDVTNLEKPRNGKPIAYSPGEERGQMDDPGDFDRLPNLGRSYRYWVTDQPGKDCFTWNPRLRGKYRIWVSWGAWTTHTKDARYVLDRDGDLSTRSDQIEIARANQSRFADGTPAIPQQKRWSGFKLAGVYQLTPANRLILRAGEDHAPLIADAVLFEEVASEDAVNDATMPLLRSPVNAHANEELFESTLAKFVRFEIEATNGGEPCLDELEVFSADTPSRNVALASSGAKATASGTFQNGANPRHQLAHIHDGLFGNDHSWISNEKGRGWVQIELAKPEHIQRITWSRDRSTGKKAYKDRLPTQYRIAISLDGKTWTTVASHQDRLPAVYADATPVIPTLQGVPAEQRAEVARCASRVSQLRHSIASLTTLPVAYVGHFVQPGPTHRLYRGDPMIPKEEVRPDAIAAFGKTLSLDVNAPEQERRLALAHWITAAENPLTARVMVNRLWHYHFGTGIVDTPSDFGLNGGKPTHPELLDWLALELIEHGWSLKHLHRLILTSATYQEASSPTLAANGTEKTSSDTFARGMASDAQSRLLWRFPPQRLEAEALRDTILSVSGQLNLTMGGPGFDLFESNSNYVKVYVTRTEYGPAEFRRMVYQSKPRVMLDNVFGAFDCPDAGQATPRRTVSTTPLQALNLLNSPFALQQAQFLAERVTRESGLEPRNQVIRLFTLAFGRSPTNLELRQSTDFLARESLPALCRAILNANEFLMVY